MNQLPRKIHLEQVHIDLRGIAPETATAAVRALGPALHRHLTSPAPNQIQPAPGMNATALTTLLAQRLAAAIHRQGNSQPEEIS